MQGETTKQHPIMYTNFETATAFCNRETKAAGHLSATTWGLYSYATKIATYNTAGSIAVVLLTTRDYSPTTIRHKSHTRRAAQAEGLALFEVPNFDNPTEAEHRANLAHLEGLAEEADRAAERAHKYGQLWREIAKDRRETAHQYATIFGLSE